VERVASPGAPRLYLPAGHLHRPILTFKPDAVPGVERGKDWSGLHHFGFQVDNMDETAERLTAAGSPKRDDVNHALELGHNAERRYGGNVEVKYSGPDGIMVDGSESGWVGTPSFSPKA